MADVRRGEDLFILTNEYAITERRLWAARVVMVLLILLVLAGGGREFISSLSFLEVGGALFGLFVMYASLVRFLATKIDQVDA